MQAGAKNPDRKSFCCPFHDDKHPSASVSQSPSGFWYFHCYVCDINEDVWGLKARVSGMPIGDVLKQEVPKDNPEPRPQPKSQPVPTFATLDELIESFKRRNPQTVIEEVNHYTDPITKAVELCTLRYRSPGQPKKFYQIAPTPDGRWAYGFKGRAPLFNRTRVAQCDKVLIVEGEKCVRELTKIGLANVAATTSPAGSNNADKADWSPLAGKECYIWRDNDANGLRYEADVIRELKKLDPAPAVYRVRVEDLGLKEKEDAANYLADEAMTNAEKVAAVGLIMFDAEPLNVTSALAEKFAKIAAGEFRAIPFEQKPRLSENSKAIMPGTLTTICGEPGAGKSFLILEDFWRWSKKGERVKLLMLEDDDAFHQNRILAQMSGNADLTDPEFVADNAEWATEVFAQYRQQLEDFCRHLETATGQMTLTEIAQWVINHAENGVRIIGVDPITAAQASPKPWIDDQQFLFEVKPVLERTGASLILTTHPRIGQAGKPSLSGMAGGASYPRFSQCVLWLRNLEKEQTGRAWDGYAHHPIKYRQTLQIRKARNGKGQGKFIAVGLNFQNLCFDEFGVVEEAVDDEG